MAAAGGLVLAACDPTSTGQVVAQMWTISHHDGQNHLRLRVIAPLTNPACGQKWSVPGVDAPAAPVKLLSSGLCLTANAAGAVGLAKCTAAEDTAVEQWLEPEADMSKWVLGASGRLCGPHGCLSVVAGQTARAQPVGAAGPRRNFLRCALRSSCGSPSPFAVLSSPALSHLPPFPPSLPPLPPSL